MATYITAHKLEVRDSPVHGRGVFATEDIKENVVVEESHLVETEVGPGCNKYTLDRYFWSGLKEGTHLISLGLASVFNSSETPNLKFEYIVEENIYRFTTTRLIHKDEELFINYAERVVCPE